ncbi:hypothetical protein IQ255_14310 [Pleurocapsales cyanobacterium LEGE 10410]|nr:hypothetical protein [Pleurocapsales cyanobacterium LEGE 10410]
MTVENHREAIQKLNQKARRSGIFANLETIGSYDDFSQIVCIDYLDKPGFLQLINGFKSYKTNDSFETNKALQKNYELNTKFYSTCVHELTHWLDHTSTLWGQKQLIYIYNAINAWTNQKEKDFYRISIAHSERLRARLAVYYTEEYATNNETKVVEPWQYEYGSGVEFGIDGKVREDRPFVYTVFKNVNDERIIRVPFSMFALTEANATYAELRVKVQATSVLEESQRLVELNDLDKTIVEDLYNSKLAIYSVATHCLANSIKTSNYLVAYELSSMLSTLCLNLPNSLYQSLKAPPEFEVFGNRIQSLKDIADPGFAFFTIAKNAPQYDSNISHKQLLEEALHNSGLPDLKTIQQSVLIEMDQLKSNIVNGIHVDKLKLLLSVGKENVVQRGIWGENYLSVENLYQSQITLPPIVLGDGYSTPISPKMLPINQEFIDMWIDQIIDIEGSIEQFIRACRL